MHSSFNFNLSLFLFFNLKLLLSFSQFCIFIISHFSEVVCSLSGKPCSNSALDVESCVFSFFSPHLGGEIVLVRSYYFVISGIQEKASDFTLSAESDIHLNSHFSHHNCWFSFIFICLNDSLMFFRMIIWLLIRLSKSMMVMLPSSVVSDSTKIWFLFVCLLNLNCHTFDLKFKKVMLKWENIL